MDTTKTGENTDGEPKDFQKITSGIPEVSQSITSENRSNTSGTPKENRGIPKDYQKNTSVNQKITSGLPKENKKITDSLTQITLKGKQSSKDYLYELQSKLGGTLGEALEHLIELAGKPAEIKEIPVEVIKEIQVPFQVNVPADLKADEAIIKLEKETSELIEVCRPYIPNNTAAEFLTALVNVSIKRTLEAKFPGAIRLHRVGK